MLDAYAVDAVTLVGGRRESLALEDVTQVTATVGARNLNAPAASTRQIDATSFKAALPLVP